METLVFFSQPFSQYPRPSHVTGNMCSFRQANAIPEGPAEQDTACPFQAAQEGTHGGEKIMLNTSQSPYIPCYLQPS
eukprot:521954-Amorphochlora_amoeboformis.AAC.1